MEYKEASKEDIDEKVVEELEDRIQDLEAEKIMKMKDFYIKMEDRFDYFMTFKKQDGTIIVCNRDITEEQRKELEKRWSARVITLEENRKNIPVNRKHIKDLELLEEYEDNQRRIEHQQSKIQKFTDIPDLEDINSDSDEKITDPKELQK